jgi:hypothetical protein
VLHLVDLVEGDERADGLVGQRLLAEELAEELQEAADRLIVALRARRAGAQRARDLEDEVDLPRQHRVDLDELLGGDRVAAVGEELQVGRAGRRARGARPPRLGFLCSRRLCTTSRMLVVARCTRSFGGKRSFAHTRNESSASSSSFCWPSARSQTLPLRRCAEGGRERAQAVDAVLVDEDVLRDLVDDEEQRGVRPRNLQHVADGADGLLGRLGARPCVPPRLVYQAIGSV